MASEIEFPVSLALRKVGPGAVLAEPLFFPEFSRLGSNRELAGTAARRNLLELVPKLDTSELLRRRRATAARELSFTLELTPPRPNEAWRDPLTLTFHAVRRGSTVPREAEAGPFDGTGPLPPKEGRYVLARVAELGIEVIAEPGENLIALLRRETLAALRRLNHSTGLRPLAFVQTTLGFAVERHDLVVRVPSLKDRAIRAESDVEEGKKSLLQQVATILGRDREKINLRGRRDGNRVVAGTYGEPAAERAPDRAERGRQDGRGARTGSPVARGQPRLRRRSTRRAGRGSSPGRPASACGSSGVRNSSRTR